MTGPILVTERLELWRPQAGDLAGIVAMVAPDQVRRHLGNRTLSMADEFARLQRNAGSWALFGYGNFIVRERETGAIVGVCGVFHSWRDLDGFDDVPEAGWIFAEPVWGRGYATEAGRAALAWFDRVHGPCRIACMIEPDNHASLTVAARLGFVACDELDFEDSRVVVLQRAPMPAPQ